MVARPNRLLATIVVACASAWPALAFEPEPVRGLSVCRDGMTYRDGRACLWYGPQPVRPPVSALSKAQDAIEAKRYDEAYQILDELIDDPKLDAYERASVWQTMAYLHAEQENYAAAIKAFVRSTEVRKADGRPGLPKAQWLSTIYNIGQLYMMVEQYVEAAQSFDTWLAEGGTPRTQALSLLATARFRLGEFDKALTAIDEAMATTPTPNEQWTRLKAAILQGLETAAARQP